MTFHYLQMEVILFSLSTQIKNIQDARGHSPDGLNGNPLVSVSENNLVTLHLHV